VGQGIVAYKSGLGELVILAGGGTYNVAQFAKNVINGEQNDVELGPVFGGDPSNVRSTRAGYILTKRLDQSGVIYKYYRNERVKLSFENEIGGTVFTQNNQLFEQEILSDGSRLDTTTLFRSGEIGVGNPEINVVKYKKESDGKNYLVSKTFNELGVEISSYSAVYDPSGKIESFSSAGQLNYGDSALIFC
jgi:hypothetical protein